MGRRTNRQGGKSRTLRGRGGGHQGKKLIAWGPAPTFLGLQWGEGESSGLTGARMRVTRERIGGFQSENGWVSSGERRGREQLGRGTAKNRYRGEGGDCGTSRCLGQPAEGHPLSRGGKRGRFVRQKTKKTRPEESRKKKSLGSEMLEPLGRERGVNERQRTGPLGRGGNWKLSAPKDGAFGGERPFREKKKFLKGGSGLERRG